MNFRNLFHRRKTSTDRRIEVVRGPSGAFHIRMVHKNGRILMSSETYSSKNEAVETAIGIACDGKFPLEIDE